MADFPTEKDYNDTFRRRLKALRRARRLTQEQMGILLGIPGDTYRKYESTNMLPHHLIERFAVAAGCSVTYLVTGEHKSIADATPRQRNTA
jgi:transcriptional regulator with XRE-family HTH domain